MHRSIRALTLLLALLLFLLMTTITTNASTLSIGENELYVSFLNIPDGEATLIQTSEGKNFLINTGSKDSRIELWEQLKELHVNQLEGLILTNQTDEYCGNMKQILENFDVKQVYYANSEKQLFTANSNKTMWNKDDEIKLGNAFNIHVLQTNTFGEMTFTIEYGENSILYMSVNDTNSDEGLESYDLKSEIIKIVDYGQSNSPSSKLLHEMDPHISIVFNQKSGTPNRDLMERLNESWIDVYQLKQVGTTIIRLNLSDYEIIS
ncbi:ComEC/Rec2 family competence protein [Paraliobacillus sediminis]|uniref:ComEC/Rec2 family competence protein n=1 Tax=Paraliobacillus sediminis TaxID=1885916 RepID=UPI000E3D26B3|nr:hypothetical protein [Paraliobacillus sediminis]